MRIATADFETDPFEHERMVQPFLVGWYDGARFITWWGSDCIEKFCKFLEVEREPWTIYFHNGGRFDFFFLLDRFCGDLSIIHNRIVRANLGIHELRDSYAIMPFPLAEYQKDSIDYNKLRTENRDAHRDEIIRYLRGDCTNLYDLCIRFDGEFGDKLTVGSASMGEIKKLHKFSRITGKQADTKIRDRFYFGGRNQVFQSGITRGRINIYDVNSMYPSVMRDSLHPVSVGSWEEDHITRNTTFLVVEGKNYGAFPTRTKTGSLDFTVDSGRYYPSIHEWNAALDCGMFQPTKIITTINHMQRGTFGEFVSHFYAARKQAIKDGDSILKIFYKYILNSGYGKFAQNPENYYDWRIAKIGEVFSDWHTCQSSCPSDCPLLWTPAFENANYIIWQRPIEVQSWYNVAAGASITGAARAILMRGIHATSEPLYCDTDSIICRGDSSVPISDSELGLWKLEASGSMVAIAGKKLYALFGENDIPVVDEKGREKKACKGANLSAREILEITLGEKIEAKIDAPALKFDGRVTWTKRTIQRTA